MGRLILVTGGARSGKSTYAEEIARKLDGGIIYVATSLPVDEEMKLRIEKHKAQRPLNWETLEVFKDFEFHLEGKLESKVGLLLDCVTIMVTNVLMEKCQDIDNISNQEAMEVEESVKTEIDKLIALVNAKPVTFILVTNEVGMGVVPEYPSGRVFRDVAGRANQMLAKAADEVYLCISGIPVKIK